MASIVYGNETCNKSPIKLRTHERHTCPKTVLSSPRFPHVMHHLRGFFSKQVRFELTQKTLHLLDKQNKLLIQKVHKCRTYHQIKILMIFKHRFKFKGLYCIEGYVII